MLPEGFVSTALDSVQELFDPIEEIDLTASTETAAPEATFFPSRGVIYALLFVPDPEEAIPVIIPW